MARNPKRAQYDVTDAELAVLQVLWQRGPSSTRELSELLYQGAGASEYATVQKLCERLEAKGCVARDRQQRPHRFAASVDRSALIGRQLKTVADRLCGGELAPLLSHLVQDSALTSDDIEGLRALVDQLEAEGGGRNARRPTARRADRGEPTRPDAAPKSRAARRARKGGER